eukprot:EG_transcript_1630
MSFLKEPSCTPSARSLAPSLVEASTLCIFVKSITNLPATFNTFGVDSKGGVSSNPADHVFNYTFQCGLEGEVIASEEDASFEDKPPSRTQTRKPSTTNFTFTNGKFRPLDADDLELLRRGLDQIEGAGADDTSHRSSSRPTTAEHTSVPSARGPPPDVGGLAAGEAERLSTENSINFLWKGLTWKERKEELDRLALEKASAKAKEKPGKKKTPKELEEEERRRKEEEDKAALSARDPLLEPPNNVCRLPLTHDVLGHLLDLAENKKPLVFRFRRCLKPSVPADTVDVNETRYRGCARLHLDPFLEPGCKYHSFVVPLEPELMDSAMDMTQAGKSKPKGGKAGKKKGELPATVLVEEDPTSVHPYLEAHTQVAVCLRFTKPLVHLPEHRPRPDFRPSDIIPRRVKPLKKPVDGVRAYASELKSIVLSLVDEWRQQGGSTDGDQDTVKLRFMAALQEKGLATSYKEKLKHCIIKIVKEKFNVKSDTPPETLLAFYNELYVYLLDLMHRTINEMFARSALTLEPAETEENKPASRWKRLAEEAEESGDLALAAKYHQERLVHDSDSPTAELQDPWYDYGTFSLRQRDLVKAEQNFKEALAIDINHLPSLLAYGTVLLSQKLFSEAEVFLQSAVDVDVNDPLPWACLGLFLELAGEVEKDAFRKREREQESNYSYSQAKRLLEARDPGSPGVYQFLATYLLDLRFEQLADHCLTSEVQRTGKASLSCFLLLGRLYFQSGPAEKAVATLQQVLDIQKENVEACLLMGDILRAQGSLAEAQAMYHRAIDAQGAGVPGRVFARLGSLQMQLRHFEDARDSYLWAAKFWPCGLTWLGVGTAYYRAGDYLHAEQALNEANILNNLNPVTWAYLCLVCLKQQRPEEADFAFNQALRQSLRDADLLAEIGTEQLALGRVQFAEGAFRKALKEQDGPGTHLLLATTLTQMRLFPEATAEFATVVATAEDEAQRQQALAQIRVIEGVLP